LKIKTPAKTTANTFNVLKITVALDKSLYLKETAHIKVDTIYNPIAIARYIFLSFIAALIISSVLNVQIGFKMMG